MRSRFYCISTLVMGVLAPALWITGLLIGQAFTDKLPNNASDAQVLTWLIGIRTSQSSAAGSS